MKKYLLLSFLLFKTLTLFSYILNVKYNFNYFYFYNSNYFSAHDLILDLENSNNYLKFFAQFDARIYEGDARYEIPYPDVDFSSIGLMPEYFYLSNRFKFTQLYLSFFKDNFNFKVGKFPLKWSFSEIYSPVDIFYFHSPFEMVSLIDYPSNMLLSFSKNNLTTSFVYQDNKDLFSSKEGLYLEYLNNFFNSRFFLSRYSQVRKNLTVLDSVENILLGISFLSEYTGPAIYNEMVMIKTDDKYRYHLKLGYDYTFFEKLYLNQEIYINFSGYDEPYDNIKIINKYLNGDFLIGKYYLFTILLFNLDENLKLSFNSILNLDDISSIWIFNLSFTPLKNILTSFSIVGTYGQNRDEFFKIPYVFLFQIGTSF